MSIDDPTIVIPQRPSLPLPLPRLALTLSHRPRRGKHQIRRVQEVAETCGSVGDEGEDLGDEGLLDEWGDRGVEFRQTGFA